MYFYMTISDIIIVFGLQLMLENISIFKLIIRQNYIYPTYFNVLTFQFLIYTRC